MLALSCDLQRQLMFPEIYKYDTFSGIVKGRLDVHFSISVEAAHHLGIFEFMNSIFGHANDLMYGLLRTIVEEF